MSSGIQAIYKLSPMQWGLLFHSLYEPESGVYVEQIGCTLRGALDVEAFAAAWTKVLERHPILRTTFIWQGVQEPVQVVHRQVPLPLERHDWSALPPAEQEERFAALAAAEKSRGFDLSAAPLLRICLIRTAEDEHRVLWSNHHLLLDGWSRAIVLGEAFALYESIRTGVEADLPSPRPFRDYVAWLEKQDRQAVESYWRRALAGFDAPTPVDFGASGAHVTPGQEPGEAGETPADRISLSARTTAGLQSLARRNRLTLSTLAQAAWALLLGRTSGEEDVVFGVTVSGRPPELGDVEAMVGLFINTLPLRVEMPAEARLLPWLGALQSRIAEMRQHESSSLAEVQRWSDVPPGKPLFESVVVFESYPVAETLSRRRGSLQVEDLRNYASTNYPIALVVEPAAEMSLRLVHDPVRFDPATLRRMLGHLRNLLESFVAAPDQTLEELPLLGAEERRQILEEWNRTAVGYPADRTVPELFAAQAERVPEAVAVVHGDASLTYAELHRRSSELARHLGRLGVAPGSLVGLHLDRRPEMIVGLLGILKAGGAYVPLDPAYPESRLAFLLEDTGVGVLLSASDLEGALPPHRARVVCLDRWEADAIAGGDAESPRVELTPEHLAYVSYTSGSTGRPKGVEVRHRGVVRLLFGAEYADFSGGRTLLQLSPIAFDASTLEIWGALLHGGRCVLLPQRVPTVAELGRTLCDHRVDTLWLTASLYNAVIDEAPESLAGVRQLLVGGEALSVPHVARGYDHLASIQIINGYGPTESTTFTCCYRIPRQLAEMGEAVRSIPIGQPIGNTRVYVLDRRLRPVPVGALGELHVGGAGLARGYLNRPELTAEKLVPDPFASAPGERLYRTGDLVRWRADGLLEFVGRIDHQVKVRGFRIEPGEIEAALVRLPGVREAAVIVREEPPAGKRLVAYVVAEPGGGAAAAELRSGLRESLPEHMVPSAFVLLRALPLTANGKLDRGRLPAPGADRADAAAHLASRSPRTDVEELLAGLWCQLLGLERVGLDDSFFELGGHSLLATQLVSRIREAFATELPLRALFDAPTVAGLAEALEAARGAEPAPAIVPARRAEGDALPLSFAQRRLWFLDQLIGASPAYNVFLPVRLEGPLQVAVLRASLDEIVRRHEILRTTFATLDGQPAQTVHPAAPLALPVVDLREEPSPEAAALALAAAEARRTFDLGRGPLIRVHLLRLSRTAHVALLAMHHIVSDGWSMGVFVRELGALYAAFAAGQPSPLPELPIQYADFAVWQVEWLRGEVLERQLDYWRGRLGGGLPVLQLPADRPRPAVQSFRGARRDVRLAPRLSEELKALGRRRGTTLFMTLLAAFQALLARLTGQEDLTVGTPIANRNHDAIEGLIGFFVNTLVLRGDLAGDPPFRELLGRTREAALGAYAHQDVPFERLVDELQPERDLSRTPLFQVVFVLQNAPMAPLALEGLTLSPVAVEAATAKHDLTLSIEETAHGLAGSLEHSTDLFDGSTVERLLGHLERLLAGVVEDPQRRLSELPLLAEAERRQILEERSPERRSFPVEAPLHRLFERQAARDPRAIAAVCDGRGLTYGNLDARANRLTRHLLGLGVMPGARVGLCLERDLELVVALLAVLKAGCAYVPLDGSLPAERLAFLLEDSGVQAVVTQESLLDALPESSAPRVCLEREAAALAAQSGDPLRLDVAPEQAAYVIYTSGSTGRPKGVVVSHANAVRLFTATEAWFGFGPQDVWTLFHSYAFDFSVWEIWGALLYGGRLVVVPYWVSRSPESFLDLLARERVTVLSQTPSAFRQLMRAEETAETAAELSLRWVVFGGEALELGSLRSWYERHAEDRPRLINMYGITETTVHVTYRELRAVDAVSGIGSRVGAAIPDLGLYVLDRHRNLVPEGVAGELCVSGAGLAWGYLGRPELTAERFVPHPFAARPGERLYRSGDLGRWIGGDLEYLGRIDHQVKVRGFRIELGEIEAALGRHEAVREAVVLARQDGAGEARLVAYVVFALGESATAGELRDFAGRSLPEHMVPAAFVALESLPLTGNGKVDRRALPAPEEDSRLATGTAYAAPRTREEEVLAGVWARVLGVERVGLHDNFFTLGGDSILSLQVRALCLEQGVDFSLQDLFEHQTIARLAAVLRAGHEAGEDGAGRVSAPFALVAEQDVALLPPGLDDAYPLTRLQAGMLFHSDYSVGSTAYHDLLSFHLRSPFDAEALEQALARLLAGHAVLRTSFASGRTSEPLQLVHATVPTPLEIEDLRALPAGEQEARLATFLESERNRQLPWDRPPLLRVWAHRRSESTFQLTLSFHHAILDGWSLASALTELFQHYMARLGKAAPPPPPPALAYREYVAAERQALASAASREFWLERWRDAAPAPLPSWGDPSPADRKKPGARFLTVPGPVAAGLDRLAREAGVPLKSLLLAAHVRVLALLTGSNEVLTGLVTNGRLEREDGERVLGLFLNTLPFRQPLTGGSWLELIRETFRRETEILPHRRYPMAEISRLAGARAAALETAFNYVHFHVYRALDGVGEVELLGVDAVEETSFALLASFSQDVSGGGLQLRLEHDANRFEPERIEAVGRFYMAALERMASHPGEVAAESCLLPAAERRQILEEWSPAGRSFPVEAPLHRLFERQAARDPRAIAAVCDGRSLSYGDLDARANRLARHLLSLGVVPGARVGLCLERDLELVVAVLAVLKAGCAYVPLDGSLPAERLAFLLEDSGVQAVVTQESLLDALPESSAPRVCLERESAALAAQSGDPLRLDVVPEQAAYVIYTSGSTGRPKGVVVSHANAVRLFTATEAWFGFGPDDVWTLFHSYAFDFSVWEIWGALLYGGRLVVVPYWVSRSPESFLDLLARERVTVLSQTPSAFRQLMRAEEAAETAAELSLRWAVFGGEALELGSLRSWYERHPEDRPRLVNMYGITETTVHVTYRELRAADAHAGTGSRIGVAIPDLQVLVLDRHQGLVPEGVAGELCVGGDGLAWGYLGRPELTAERFVPHPSWNPTDLTDRTDPSDVHSGARLYRSGDLARWVNGDLEYLGRIDHQVKVRGFRIELGEIEAALGRHAAVRETVVVARPGASGEARLVAYVVFAPGESATAGELRDFAGRSLPEHMVPSAFVALESLPLTGNGKVDRRALPAPEEESRLATGDGYVAPRTREERVLAEVWARVLRVERVGRHDNFFALGGDSILSLQVISRCREAGLVLTPKQIFDCRDLAELAEAATPVERAAAGEETVAGAVPLTPIQSWFFARNVPDPHHWNQALLLTVPAGMEPAVADAAVADLLTHHPALRLRFFREDGAWRQMAAEPGGEAPFTDVDLSALPQPGRRGALEAAAARIQTSLDLERGPLLRVARFRLGPGEPDRLLFVAHHLAVDGVSWRILLEDFHTACRQRTQGEPVRLPRPSTSFTAWAARLAEHARSPAVREELSFWREVAAGPPARLPVDGPGGPEAPNAAASAQTLAVALDPDETAALLHEIPRAYRTQINDVLLTALGQALCRWTGSRAVLVDLESHGREPLFDGVDLSRTAGWFTAVYPVRLAAGEGDPGRALRRTKERLRAIPAGGLGYGLLRFLAGDREISEELARLPSAQVSFNYLGQLDAAVPGASGFAAAPESSGPAQSPRVERPYPLEIVASVSGGRLQLVWIYSEALHRRETVARLAEGLLVCLRSLIVHCLSPEAGGFSPSDFPLARIDQEALDRLLAGATDVEDLYPLSPLQEGILFESLVDGDPEIYFEQLGYRLRGPLDPAAFREAWRSVLVRHPVLRTTFLWEGLDRPLQRVRRGVELAWSEEDWRSEPEASRPERLDAFLWRDRRAGFDLSRPPLTRFALIRLAEEEHFFVWSHHHLLLDGWCLGLIVQEVFQLYRSGVEGRQAVLEPRRPYRDYVAWLERQDLAAAERFWRDRLAGITAPTPLTVDRPATGPREAAPGEEDLLLSPEDSAALDAFARSRGLTPSTLFHAAWALLLARYGASTRVLFGSVVSGRPPELAQAAEMIGLFINTLPVPVAIEPERPVGLWLESLQSELADLRQFEHSPLAKVQAWSDLPAGTPLFESLLVFENYQRAPALPSAEVGLRVVEVRFFESTGAALTLAVGPGREILLHAEYDRGRFDAPTVGRLLGHLRTLLLGMVAGPELALADLPLLTASEETQLLVGWNATGRALPAAPVHALFAAMAARQPEAPAVLGDHGSLSYGELDRAANRLARRLRRLGAGPEILVGICLERSPDLAVAILAVLKAGAAYLPLDPSYPAERLAFLIRDAGLSLVVGREHPLPEGVRVLRLDAEDLSAESDRDPGVEAPAEALAYALYTSGSTGQPKSVLTPHSALTNYAYDMVDRFGLRPDDRVLQFAPLSFDVLVEELVPTWLAGAAVVFADPRETATCAGLQGVLERHRVTGVELPATFWQEWVHDLVQAGAEPPSALRFVLVGCDKPAPARVADWQRFGRALIHVFGLAETTITTTLYELQPGDGLDLPIGRPIANTAIYLLDAQLRPVPVGVPGELFIGGRGVGRGYLGRPELTAERFVPDPFGGAGERLYRTGDLARFRADGNVEFLGRMDDQVKVRGFRIEPAEVEAALRRHPAVGEAVVMARGEAPADRALVAWVAATEAVGPQDLRAHVAAVLPDYMVPSSVVVLDQLPRTRHGKVDRRALAALTPVHGTRERRPAPPRGPIEEMMAGLWTEVLEVDRVGGDDSFFELGGHSLLATRLISRIRRAFGVELPLRSLFEKPVLAALSREVEESLRAERGTAAPPLVPVPRSISGEAGLPLSFAQERLWFLDQLEPDNPLYNMPAALRLHGPLRVPALEASLGGIVRRHETLRTGFGELDGRPVQRIVPALAVPLPVVDLMALPPAAREEEAGLLAAAEAHRPFRLAEPPLLRATLLRLGAEEHMALFTMHHIVSDAWSIGVLVREIGALYQACLAGRPAPLPELPVQYADFAAWQRQWLEGEVLERQLAYWRRQLGGGVPALQLPTDRPRPAVQSFRGSRRDLVFGPPLGERLAALGRAEGTTLFMTLLAAFQALLSRLTGQDDLTVGSPVASRDREELEGLIGFFLNTLVLRGDLSGDPSFRELLGRTREAALGAYAHQDVPFERLVDELQPERDLSRTPLFQVMLVLQNAPTAPLILEGLTLRPAAVEVDTAKFDLTLSLEETAYGLAASLEHSTDLFDGSTADRLLERLGRLLEAVAEDPRQRLSELPLLSEAERRQILEERSPAGRSFPVEAPLHRLFERQAALRPQAPAAVCEGHSLTYGDLDARANRLARHLLSLGVMPGARVGLCLERDLELVVALLAVLKAGCAYVPLDGSLPAERLAFLLEDSGVQAVITQESLLDALPESSAPRVCLEREAAALAAQSGDPLRLDVVPEQAAYVIYTSGSTGRPKGVVVSQANAVRLFTATEAWFGVGPEDVWTLFHSYAFDFSVWEIWGALLYGGRLVVVPYWVSRSPESFLDLLARERVTVLSQTPSAFRQLMRAEEAAATSPDLSLRWVVFGGEALELGSLRSWYERHAEDRPRLVNMYGITETTVHVTYRALSAADAHAGTGSRIGAAIPDLQVLVLDRHQNLVPEGVAGELCVGGDGLAWGYLGRPELTAERFVPHPFWNPTDRTDQTDPSDVHGARLYRSGDLGRWVGGDLEYLGRIDHQVKVRGFRIELGEIEAALGRHAAVRETVVLARPGASGEARLVAYVVFAPGESATAGELRDFAGRSLPEHMVPSAFVALESLPLTGNGKVDRRALPAPEEGGERLAAGEGFAAPRTREERVLAEVWARVLRVERVGVHDNFFALGGDSILSLQIVSQARREGLHLTPKQIFQHQTVEELAAAAEAAGTGLAAEAEEVVGEVPLTPIQAWFFEQDPVAPHHSNQSVLLSVRRPLDAGALERSVASLMERHDALRMRFAPTASGWEQRLTPPGGETPFTRVDLSALPDRIRSAAVEAAAAALQESLGLAQGPLLRVASFDLGPGVPGRLLMIVHHLAVDGVSWRILLDDLEQTFERLSQDGTSEAAPRTTSFAHWARRLRSHARSPELRAEAEHWLAQAPGLAAALPVERAAGPNTVASSRVVTVALEEEETRSLLQDVPKAYRTQINDVLLTALARTLCGWLGSESALVELEGHGREEILDGVDLSRTVGWFTSIFPVALTPGRGGLEESLKSIKEQLRRVPSRGVGYGLLRYLGDEDVAARLRRLPRAEVSFNYLGQFDQTLQADSAFGMAPESSGPSQSPLCLRPHLLEVNGSVLGGRLRMSWIYSDNLHSADTVERLAASFLDGLRRLIAHCATPGRVGYTPSDFPLAGLDQAKLDRVLGNDPGVEDLYPLSPMQQGILFHALYSPGSLEYFNHLICKFNGRLDIAALQDAWRHVIRGQSIFRTAFLWEGLDEPLQIVRREAEPAWELDDWRGLDPAGQEARLSRFLEEDCARGFDFSQAPLMRMFLFRLTDESWQFVWSHHHLLLDGWSLPVLFGQSFRAYSALVQGRPPAGERSRPFRDYIAWLRGQDLSRAEAFWRRYLAGFTTPTPLPAERSAAPAAGVSRYAAERLLLAEEATAALQERARGCQLTVNTLVQATWALLLHRFSGSADVVYGMVVSGRPAELAGMESMIGPFINALPVRARIDRSLPALDWLRSLQEAQTEIRQYEHSSLTQIQGWSEVPRGRGLFESSVAFDNYPTGTGSEEPDTGVVMSDGGYVDWNSYPISLDVAPGDKLSVSVKYNVDRFDRAVVLRILRDFEIVLRAFAGGFQMTVQELLDLLDEADRQERARREEQYQSSLQSKLKKIRRPVAAYE